MAVHAAALSLATVGAVGVWMVERAFDVPRVDAVAHATLSESTAAPAYLGAVEEHCRADGADRCDLASAIGRDRALREADVALGDAARFDHAFVRYDSEREQLIWSARDFETKTRVELDAVDGSVLEVSFWDAPGE
jgi:hypothetical protein